VAEDLRRRLQRALCVFARTEAKTHFDKKMIKGKTQEKKKKEVNAEKEVTS